MDHPSASEELAEAAAELGAASVAVDLCSSDSVPAILEALDGQSAAPVNAVVHSAGVTRDRTLRRMSNDEWESVLDVNLAAVVRLDEGLIVAGSLAPGASVVCVSSISALGGNLGQTNYAASKAGLLGYCRWRSAADGADRSWRSVAPGFIETKMTAKLPLLNRMAAGRFLTPLGAPGRPEDVAAAISFLASPASSGLMGCLRVCGGLFFGR